MPVIPAFYAHISFGFIDYDFGVIAPSHRGTVFLWYKLQFVLQRHTLPVERVDCDEASSPLGGCLLRSC